MEYVKIKVLSRDDPERFYRIIAVKKDISLYELGAVIAYSINSWLEHLYFFSTKDVEFVHDSDDGYIRRKKIIPMVKASLKDLGDKFVYEYDTGASWYFDCRVLKRTYNDELADEEKDPPIGIVIEGKGQGIFENDHHSLRMYLFGEIDPECNENNEKEGYYLPMNMDFEKFGDFDKELDLKGMRYYADDVAGIVSEYIDYFHDDASDYEKDDEELEYDAMAADEISKTSVSYSIFNDKDINAEFRKLIEKHDINEAYQMIVDAFRECMKESNSEEEVEKDFLKKVKNLSNEVKDNE